MKDALGHGSNGSGWDSLRTPGTNTVRVNSLDGDIDIPVANLGARHDLYPLTGMTRAQIAARYGLSGAQAVGAAHGLPIGHGQGGTSERGRFGTIWASRLKHA